MPETEPITVGLRADSNNLKTGLEQGRSALREFGSETEHTSLNIRKMAGDSRQLFSALVQMRVASMATQNVLKELGLNNEYVSGTFKVMNAAMDVAIAVSAIYRATKVAEAVASWFAAKAKMADAVATVSASTLFLGTTAAVAAALAALALIGAFSAPKLQFGGIIPARIGGTPVLAGEAGKPEAIIPLDRMGEFGGIGGGIHINIERIETNDPRELVRTLGREIELARLAGA